MRAFQDKVSGLWKWGTRGEPKYNTKQECERAELELLTERLRELRKKVEQGWLNHGR